MIWGLIPIQVSPGAPPSLLMDARGSFLRRKKLGHEVNDSPPSNGGVKNKRWYTSASPASLHCMDRDKLTVPFNLHCKRSHLFCILKPDGVTGV